MGYGYEPYLFTLAPGELKKAPEITKLEEAPREGLVRRSELGRESIRK